MRPPVLETVPLAPDAARILRLAAREAGARGDLAVEVADVLSAYAVRRPDHIRAVRSAGFEIDEPSTALDVADEAFDATVPRLSRETRAALERARRFMLTARRSELRGEDLLRGCLLTPTAATPGNAELASSVRSLARSDWLEKVSARTAKARRPPRRRGWLRRAVARPWRWIERGISFIVTPLKYAAYPFLIIMAAPGIAIRELTRIPILGAQRRWYDGSIRAAARGDPTVRPAPGPLAYVLTLTIPAVGVFALGVLFWMSLVLLSDTEGIAPFGLTLDEQLDVFSSLFLSSEDSAVSYVDEYADQGAPLIWLAASCWAASFIGLRQLVQMRADLGLFGRLGRAVAIAFEPLVVVARVGARVDGFLSRFGLSSSVVGSRLVTIVVGIVVARTIVEIGW